MSDIDFDELDRAINKVVGKENIEKNETAPPSDDADNASEASSEKTSSSSQPPANSPNTINSSSGGRFMDLVHPSSDMRNDSSDSNMMSHSNSSLDNSYEKSTKEPDADVVQNDDTDEFSLKESPDVSSNESPEKDNDLDHTSMPDPLDFDPSAKKEETVADMVSASDNDISKKMQDIPVEPPAADNGSTPFLDDVPPVEKRPLGGWDPSKDEKDYSKVIAAIKQKDSTDPEKPDEDISLPPELQKELVAIEESNELTPELASLDNAASDDTKKQLETSSLSSKKSDDASKDPPVSGLLATGSIPQQYKTVSAQPESVAVHEGHPLFDDASIATKTTGKSPKKDSSLKHTLRWIMIIIGLLLLGATLGAAAYVYITGNQAFPL